MKALILDGKVIQIEKKEFPVHGLDWVDCSKDVKTGWTYDGEKFSEPEIDTSKQVFFEIEALEAQQTPRLLREAALGDEYALGLLRGIDDQIKVLRGQL